MIYFRLSERRTSKKKIADTELTTSPKTGFQPQSSPRQSAHRGHQRCTRYYSTDRQILAKGSSIRSSGSSEKMEDGETAAAIHDVVTSDVEEDDPGRLLNAWLGELDTLKKVLPHNLMLRVRKYCC